MATTKKSDGTTLVNPTTAGVVYDKEGHSLGGGESITVEKVDAVGRAAIDAGQLLCRSE
jgi:hypothetical protein